MFDAVLAHVRRRVLGLAAEDELYVVVALQNGHQSWVERVDVLATDRAMQLDPRFIVYHCVSYMRALWLQKSTNASVRRLNRHLDCAQMKVNVSDNRCTR